MVPYDHARLHARDFKGVPEDYLPIDEFLDESKLHFADTRHRCVLHNSFGMGICERVFGPVITNSDGIEVPVREIARRHIMQDCGCVPTLKETMMSVALGTHLKYDKPLQKELDWLKENVYTPT